MCTCVRVLVCLCARVRVRVCECVCACVRLCECVLVRECVAMWVCACVSARVGKTERAREFVPFDDFYLSQHESMMTRFLETKAS